MAAKRKPKKPTRDMAYIRIMRDPELRKVLIELLLPARSLVSGSDEYERGIQEGYRRAAQAGVERLLAIDQPLGTDVLRDIITTRESLWPKQAPKASKEPEE